MRTLALAIAATLPVWLAAPAAQAVCTSGVDCIRERFGTDFPVRNNRIIDRTDNLGDRHTPLNPYVARQGGPATAPSRAYAGTSGPDRNVVAPGVRRQVEPGVWYTPEAGFGLQAPGGAVPGVPGPEAGEAEALTIEPYAPAEPATGPATGPAERPARPTGLAAGGIVRAPAPRPDPNRPQGAAELRYGGPGTAAPYGGARQPGVNR